MKISINIIEKHIENYVMLENIRDDADMTIESYEIYSNKDACKESYLYVVEAEELPNAEELTEKLNFICYGIPEGFDIRKFEHINLLMVDDASISVKKLINSVISIFRKYNVLGDRFDRLIYVDFNLQKIIDLATEMVEMPLCMLNLNHNVLAISSKMDAPDDALWLSMKAGYGYANYDVVLKSEPKLNDLIEKEIASVELISNISGHYLKISMLYNGNHAVATLGIHKLNHFKFPFEKHTIQIYDYIVEKINSNFNAVFETKADKGFLYEQFLYDIVNGKLKGERKIKNYLSKLGFTFGSNYQMGLISFKESLIRTDYYNEMMDHIEQLIPNSKCIIMDSFIYIIISINTNDYLSSAVQKKMSEFLNAHQCFCILSPVFLSMGDLPKINAMFKAILAFVKAENNNAAIYHFYEYASIYGMKILSDHMQMKVVYHPVIQKLIDYDREHHSNYLETFKVYLRSESNISVASNLLQMHRNTLLYRINRIEELLGECFDDPELREQLLFYLRYLEITDTNHKSNLNKNNES